LTVSAAPFSSVTSITEAIELEKPHEDGIRRRAGFPDTICGGARQSA
jgi:hypothetical protein